MKPDDTNIEEQATRLPHRKRAELALRLIESLDPGRDEDVDQLWLDEAELRLKRYDEGAAEAQNAEEAITEIERDLT